MSKFVPFSEFQRLSESYKKIPNSQLGSNDGGIYTSQTGEKVYAKHYKNDDQAKAEVLSGKIHRHLGIHTTGAEHKTFNGHPAVVSKFNDNLKQMRPSEFKSLDDRQAAQMGKMYHAAVLTKNWDVVGLGHDNIVKDSKTGDLHSIDHGGSFHFRAMGNHKDYDPEISEHSSLRNDNENSGQVFNHVFKNHPQAEHEGIKAVRGLDDAKIHHDFKTSGLPNWKELHKNFQERKNKLLAKYK